MRFLKNITSGRSTTFQQKSHIHAYTHGKHKLDLMGGKRKEDIKLGRSGKVVDS